MNVTERRERRLKRNEEIRRENERRLSDQNRPRFYPKKEVN